jgi:hypothetical protein
VLGGSEGSGTDVFCVCSSNRFGVHCKYLHEVDEHRSVSHKLFLRTLPFLSGSVVAPSRRMVIDAFVSDLET